MDKVLAFRKGEVIETFEDHVNECVNFVEEHYLKRNYHIMLSRKMYYSADVIKDMLTNAARLHDIAKTYEPYQSRIKRGESAFGHEIFSAVIFHKIFGIEYLPFTIAILYHHHTMSGTNHSEIFARFSRIREKIKSGGVSLEMDSTELAGIVGVNAKFPEVITFEDAKNVLMEFFRKYLNYDGTNLTYIFSILILHPILRGDNFAAGKNRNNGGKRRQKYWIPVSVSRDVLCD